MEEKITTNAYKTSASIVNGELDSIKNIKENYALYKVLEDGMIGISVSKNLLDDQNGFKTARENMSRPYPHNPAYNIQMNVKSENSYYKQGALLKFCEDMSAYLKDSAFENVNIIAESKFIRRTYTNQRLLHLNSERVLNKILICSDTKNGDFLAPLYYRNFDAQKCAEDIAKLMNAREKSAAEVHAQHIIIPSTNFFIYDYFEKVLNPDYYLNQSDEISFSKKMTLMTSLNPEDNQSLKYGLLPFFDSEGSCNQYFRKTLIDGGKFVSCYYDKDAALKYDKESTACAYAKSGDYSQNRLLGAYILPAGKIQNGSYVLVRNMVSSLDKDVLTLYAKECYKTDGNEIIGKTTDFEIRVSAEEFFNERFVMSAENSPLSTAADSLIFRW